MQLLLCIIANMQDHIQQIIKAFQQDEFTKHEAEFQISKILGGHWTLFHTGSEWIIQKS